MKKSEFIRLIESVKKAYDKAYDKENELFILLEEALPNVDLEEVASKAENADNIRDAITCYCQRGEYDPVSIWDELSKLKKRSGIVSYSQILDKFTELLKFKDNEILDYRPYSGIGTIYIWLKDGRRMIFKYVSDDLYYCETTTKEWDLLN